MNETESTIKVLDKIGQRGMVAMLGSAKYWWVRIVSSSSLDTAKVVYIEGGFGFGDARGFIDRKRKGFEMLEALAEYPYVAAKLAEPLEVR